MVLAWHQFGDECVGKAGSRDPHGTLANGRCPALSPCGRHANDAHKLLLHASQDFIGSLKPVIVTAPQCRAGNLTASRVTTRDAERTLHTLKLTRPTRHPRPVRPGCDLQPQLPGLYRNRGK